MSDTIQESAARKAGSLKGQNVKLTVVEKAWLDAYDISLSLQKDIDRKRLQGIEIEEMKIRIARNDD
jgi:hypothetical protein